jgi:hypothetical protein
MSDKRKPLKKKKTSDKKPEATAVPKAGIDDRKPPVAARAS